MDKNILCIKTPSKCVNANVKRYTTLHPRFYASLYTSHWSICHQGQTLSLSPSQHTTLVKQTSHKLIHQFICFITAQKNSINLTSYCSVYLDFKRTKDHAQCPPCSIERVWILTSVTLFKGVHTGEVDGQRLEGCRQAESALGSLHAHAGKSGATVLPLSAHFTNPVSSDTSNYSVRSERDLSEMVLDKQVSKAFHQQHVQPLIWFMKCVDMR